MRRQNKFQKFLTAIVCCVCALAALGLFAFRFTDLSSLLLSDRGLCDDRYSSKEVSRIMDSTATSASLVLPWRCTISFSDSSTYSFLDIRESADGKILLHLEYKPLTEDEIRSKDGVRGKVERLDLAGYDGTVLLWTDDFTYGASNVIWFMPDGVILAISFNTITTDGAGSQDRDMAINLFKYISEKTLVHPYV